MREIREVEAPKKPLSWNEIQKRALAKAVGLSEDSNRYPPEETPSETIEKKTE